MKDAKKGMKRKGVLRRPAVQVELELPPPAVGGGSIEFVEIEPQWWQRRGFVLALGCALLWLTVLTSGARGSSHRDRAAAAHAEERLKVVTLRPATQVRAVRITPNPRSWSSTPDATVTSARTAGVARPVPAGALLGLQGVRQTSLPLAVFTWEE